MQRRMFLICALLIAIWASVAPAANAPKAAAKQPEPNKASGLVTAVAAATISIQTERNGAMTFSVTDATAINMGDAKSTISNIRPGDNATVAFIPKDKATPWAKSILLTRPAVAIKKKSASGVVTKITETGIALDADTSGPQAYAIDSRTKVKIGSKDGKLSDVKVGDRVRVVFIPTAAPPFTAKDIMVMPPIYRGKVDNITTDGFSLTSQDQTWKVFVTPETRFSSHSYHGKASDLRSGYRATVAGRADGSNITAAEVEFEPSVLRGKVKSTTSVGIAITGEKDKLFTIATGGSSVVMIVGAEGSRQGTLGDIKPGMTVSAGGQMTGENMMTAIWIYAFADVPGRK